MTPTTRRLMFTIGLIGAGAVWLAASTTVGARQRGGRVTPRRTVEAVVDGVKIDMEYGGPFKRDRRIWGGLVPWDRWWMPGSDDSTSLVTSAPLEVGALSVPAGEHTIYTLPGAQQFLLIINKETGTFHTHYNAREDLGRTPMALKMLPEPVEEMTFAIDSAPTGGGVLKLTWDDREYSVALKGAGPAAAASPAGR